MNVYKIIEHTDHWGHMVYGVYRDGQLLGDFKSLGAAEHAIARGWVA